MASYQLAPVLFLAPGAEPQVNAQRAAADSSTGQGNIASGLFLENKSGTAARADAGTVETTVLGYCTNVLDANLKPLPKGSYLSSNEAGFVDYIPDAQLLANNDLFIMGEDGATTTIQAFINAGNTIAAGIYFGLINTAANSVTDDLSRVGVDASFQRVVQVASGASISATQGTLPFQVVSKYISGKQVPDDPTATDAAAADWIVKRVNA